MEIAILMRELIISVHIKPFYMIIDSCFQSNSSSPFLWKYITEFVHGPHFWFLVISAALPVCYGVATC
ncbi:hypothetical protein DAI22_02g089500 [Oryza sativa Japonica Group]|nr:hypothetical protein DAI22_02g089500 [Oryza sativa Japonica Group]